MAGERGALRLQPDWKTTVTAALLLPLLLSLGFWQLDRAEQKRDIAQRHAERLLDAPRPVSQWPADDAEFRPAMAAGQYLNQRSILLDNRMRDSRFGYEVLTPLEIPGDPRLLLVNRGWVEGDRSRQTRPVVPAIAGEVLLQGQLALPDRRRIAALDGRDESWPRLAQWPDPQALAQALGRDVHPFILRLNAGQAGALRTDWPLLASGPERHVGYAVQWFTMAAVLVMLWLYISLQRQRPEEVSE